MYAVFREEEIFAVFENQENAEKYLCIEYENDSEFEIRELDEGANGEYSPLDQEYEEIPYRFFAVEVSSEIIFASNDRGAAEESAYRYNQEAIQGAHEELGHDEDDYITEKGQFEAAWQAGFESGHAEVINIIPESDEQYRDCIDLWRNKQLDDEEELEEDEM
ncbi:hypothetical protein [Cohnella hashimotonis]|uniref:DUF1292 domain-containing protein n=1 Tax=Cohnella hashimotonis TaxID=2826895 RepID=A0ABT6TPL1_9BACL|nr:hypothetical protein [Cohnella hashimotonis]MDI4648776.1 hypothetical protein [Cohnella hashimotonis]